MIQVIPSIAIRKGKVVKMRKGDPASEKAYDENPLDLAKRFQDNGIEVIHLVDLDGADRGRPVNWHTLEALTGYTDLKIDFTVCISTDGDISKAYEFGADYITAASIAVTDPELFASWIVSYGREKMTLGADVVDRGTKELLYRGWRTKSKLTLFEHLEYFYSRGLKYVKSTDVSRDGVMEGPAFDYYQEIIAAFPEICVLASQKIKRYGRFRRHLWKGLLRRHSRPERRGAFPGEKKLVSTDNSFRIVAIPRRRITSKLEVLNTTGAALVNNVLHLILFENVVQEVER
jgi:phosphoribosylformimino-5-aminoimidazole carboxamide ribotide isomerase